MQYSDEVLEETPERVTRFLTGLGAVSTIRTLLAGAGMRDEDIEEGRHLLLGVLAAPQPMRPQSDTEDARRQRAAVAELDGWDEVNFARYEATLQRRFPEVARYVFADLKAATGPAAVQGVATFLARIDALESGQDPSRAARRSEDLAAVEHLGQRGLTREERARLQGLVRLALGPTAPLAAPAAPDPTEGRRRALAELRAWYDEWAETARAVVKQRIHLIRLGLARRRSPRSEPKA